MTSNWPPKLFCLICGVELPTFDDLAEHTSKNHKQDNPALKTELQRVIKQAMEK